MEHDVFISNLVILTQKVDEAVAKAILGQSKLSPEVLALEGMSSHGIRHLLNNVCELVGGNYLEIGSWRGSTFISALYKNADVKALSIDHHEEFVNHEQFKTTADMLADNCKRMLIHNEQYQLVTADCFKVEIDPAWKFNIYLYDGYHSYECQYQAISKYYKHLTDMFIYICDDFSCYNIEDATRAAFRDMNIEVISEHKMYGYQNVNVCRKEGFWNGYYIAVCVKRMSFPLFYGHDSAGKKVNIHRFS